MTELELLRQIAAKARDMRQMQTEFFKTHKHDALIGAKNYERELDQLLETHLRGSHTEQPALF